MHTYAPEHIHERMQGGVSSKKLPSDIVHWNASATGSSVELVCTRYDAELTQTYAA